MNTFIKLLFALTLLVVSNPVVAQDAEKPGWFVLQQNKVLMKDMPKVNALQDSLFTPILNELVAEGKLKGWGQLTHAWGDDWNYNFYFVTDNHQAFIDFWKEYFSRVNKRFPRWYNEVTPLFIAHKDNMYHIRTMR